MCFKIHKNHQEVKIATRNIPCYKRLELIGNNWCVKKITRGNLPTLKFQTPYFYQRVFLQHKPLKKSPIDVGLNEIEKGLHSYSHPSGVTNNWRRSFNEVIVKCIIPKGSKYYYNPDAREYVSNKLQYTTKFITNDCDYIEIKDKKLICEDFNEK